ncbi:MAG: MerR family transcriptional regulator [Robiginitomaculum sp.]
MTQVKSTRAFRTISEAAGELELQAHVLRFWESKFSQIQPMKRRGGRRFYRPEDIEFLRGIKILLHREKHPIKDVQKLIRIKGAQSIVELGRSKEIASKPRNIKDTVLVPKRIKPVIHKPTQKIAIEAVQESVPEPVVDDISKTPKRDVKDDIVCRVVPINQKTRRRRPEYVKEEPEPEPVQVQPAVPAVSGANTEDLRDVLNKLRSMKSSWEKFKQ